MGAGKNKRDEEMLPDDAENYILEMLFALARLAVKSGHNRLGTDLHEHWLRATRQRDTFRRNSLNIVRDFTKSDVADRPLTYVVTALIMAAEVLRNETKGLMKDGPDPYSTHADEIEKISARIGEIGATLGVEAFGLATFLAERPHLK